MAVKALEITSRGPLANGQSFGEYGSYEYIQGLLHFAVDPGHPQSMRIADMDAARRGADGQVHFAADFYLIKPTTPAPGGKLLYEVINRGRKLAPGHFNWSTGAGSHIGPDLDLGDGFLMKHGFSQAYLGWQIDVPPVSGSMAMQVPDAIDALGAPLVTPTFVTITPVAVIPHIMLSDRVHKPWPTKDIEDASAILTVREYPDGPATVIERSKWRFARVVDGMPTPDACYAALEGGFQPGMHYELYYNALGAPLVGLSYLGTRDCVSWLRYGSAAEGNPLAGDVGNAYGFGASMSGRYLRELLFWGMNEDEEGRIVFDGLSVHTGSSRRGEFNMRGGQPSSNVSRAPGNTFPFSYNVETDPHTGAKGSLLDRQSKETQPKIMVTNSGIEYWWSGASQNHTDPAGSKDVEPPENVRVYYLAGAHHQPGKIEGYGAEKVMFDGLRLKHQLNTVDYTPIMRALMLNLDRWVREGVAPPPSQHPRLSNGTAVARESVQGIFNLMGASFPKAPPVKTAQDYGPDEQHPTYPPKEGGQYGILVSSVDADGNEVAGVRLPDLRVPLATYTGWNVRHADSGGENHQVVGGPLLGSTFALPKTAADRQKAGDPRSAIDERYKGKDDYLARVRSAAEELAGERYILPEDIETVVGHAAARWDAFRG